jgi:16S rRNA (cytosine967-C5)-methyltransferase
MNQPRRPPSSKPDSVPTGRHLAFLALKELDESGMFLADGLDRHQPEGLSPADRALAMELSYTVTRRRTTLDLVLRQLVARDPENVERDLWTILRLGAAQLLLIEGLPAHAAVHETVEVAKLVNARWGGMVNGVLRSLQRLLTTETTTEPGPASIPIVDVQPAGEEQAAATINIHYRTLNSSVFPDPARDPQAYTAAAFSMPRELIARWSHGWDAIAARRTSAWFTTGGVMSLRVNPLRTTRDAILTQLRESGVDCWPGAMPESIRLAEATRISRLPGFDEGQFSVQDESAQAIVDQLAPKPGERIHDLCAAPGGKSTHLAERMQNQGTVLACDLSPRRLRLVDESAYRLGLTCITTHAVTDDPASIPTGPFDAAIVDAPCSNTGVLGKRPEARWRLTEADFVELPQLQLKLLTAAADRIRSGGRLAYSTCSIDAAENEGVIRQFLGRNTEWSTTATTTSQPGAPGDGGFIAILSRS